MKTARLLEIYKDSKQNPASYVHNLKYNDRPSISLRALTRTMCFTDIQLLVLGVDAQREKKASVGLLVISPFLKFRSRGTVWFLSISLSLSLSLPQKVNKKVTRSLGRTSREHVQYDYINMHENESVADFKCC